MSRVNLFEFEDFAWFPRVLRNHMTSFLHLGHTFLTPPAFWIQCLEKALRSEKTGVVIDLCSGKGGPLFAIEKELNKSREHKIKFVLSDLYPNLESAEVICRAKNPNISYFKRPVSAHDLPQSLRGVRTLIAGFHHFSHKEAMAILRNASESRSALCVFEVTTSRRSALFVAALLPFLVVFLTPFIRPLSFSQIFFTYVIPLVPFLVFWDGFASFFRTYSKIELEKMVAQLKCSEYVWEVGEFRAENFPFALPYVLGLPLEKTDQTSLASASAV